MQFPPAVPSSAPTHDRPLLGDLLIERGLLDEETLETALLQQLQTGQPLGRVLVSRGDVSRQDIYWVLAEQWGLPLVDMTTTTVEEHLLLGLDPHVLVDKGFFPLEDTPEGLLVATSSLPGERSTQRIREIIQTDKPLIWYATTDWDIAWAVSHYCKDTISTQATLTVDTHYPQYSARTPFTPAQKFLACMLLAGLGAALALAPSQALLGLFLLGNVLVGSALLYQYVPALVGLGRRTSIPVSDADLRSLQDEDLPSYTILVPVHRQENAVPLIVDNILGLDYPREKLEVLLLIEENDHLTRQAATQAAPPALVRFVTVPPGFPQTKAKACNVGLAFATGELVVVFDVTDRPARDHLKRAVVAFGKGGETTASLQGTAITANAHRNMLTRLGALENVAWHKALLPALRRLGLPVSSSSSSHHFRTDVLRRLGGWDPCTVTEDVTLGVRVRSLGFTEGSISATTLQKTPDQFSSWLWQRSRWFQSSLQTGLILARQPNATLSLLGRRATLGLALSVAGTPVAHLLLPLLVVSTLVGFAFPSLTSAALPLWAVLGAGVNLGSIALVTLLVHLVAGQRQGTFLTPWALLQPVYWVLHSLAAYRALWQLCTDPFHWEGTARRFRR